MSKHRIGLSMGAETMSKLVRLKEETGAPSIAAVIRMAVELLERECVATGGPRKP